MKDGNKQPLVAGEDLERADLVAIGSDGKLYRVPQRVFEAKNVRGDVLLIPESMLNGAHDFCRIGSP
jgi:hypothetical protein